MQCYFIAFSLNWFYLLLLFLLMFFFFFWFVCFVFFVFQSTLIIFRIYCQVPSCSHQVERQKTDRFTRGGVQSPGRVNGVSESAFLVEVDKSSCSLGLTLEGGSDVGSDVRIKSLKVRQMGSQV